MAAMDFRAMTRRGTCRNCRKRRLLDQNSHLCGECHNLQGSIWQVARQGSSPAPAASNALAVIGNRSMEREQLYSDFVFDTHQSRSDEEHKRVMTISYLTELQSTQILSPILNGALDALSWAHAGNVHNDRRLTHASREAYGRALTSLRRIIETPSTTNRPAHWEVLATVMLLSIIDTSLNQDSGVPGAQSAWLTHFWGAQQYLSTIGASSLDLDHVVSKVMTFSMYQSAVLLGLSLRRKIDLKAAQWTEARTPDHVTRPWGVIQMQRRFLIFQPVPGLLEETDRLIGNAEPSNTPKLFDLWRRLGNQHAKVAQCVQDGMDHATETLIPEASFDLDLEEHQAILENVAFDTVIAFDVLDAGVYFCCTVLIQLVVECTLLRLLHFNINVRNFPNQRRESDMEQSAFELALKLCQCVHYLSQLDSLAYARFTVLLLHLAQNVFTTQGRERELQWCQACLLAVHARLRRISQAKRPTLCRIGDLPPGITQSGLYHEAETALPSW